MKITNEKILSTMLGPPIFIKNAKKEKQSIKDTPEPKAFKKRAGPGFMIISFHYQKWWVVGGIEPRLRCFTDKTRYQPVPLPIFFGDSDGIRTRIILLERQES